MNYENRKLAPLAEIFSLQKNASLFNMQVPICKGANVANYVQFNPYVNPEKNLELVVRTERIIHKGNKKPEIDPLKYLSSAGSKSILISLEPDQMAALDLEFLHARADANQPQIMDEARSIARAKGLAAANQFLREQQYSVRSRTNFVRFLVVEALNRRIAARAATVAPNSDPLMPQPSTVQFKQPKERRPPRRTLEERRTRAKELLGITEEKPMPRQPSKQEVKFAKAFARASGMEPDEVLALPRRKILPRKKAAK